MSISALLKGVEKHLRSAALFNDVPAETIGKRIGIQPNPGKPPPNFGQWYLAIRWGGGRGWDQDPQSHDVTNSVILTLTARLNYAPKDRHAIQLTNAPELYAFVDRLTGPNVVHGNDDLRRYANESIPGTAEALTAAGEDPAEATVNGYLEPLVLGPFGPERPVGGDWIGATDAKDAYVIDMRFDLARRIQTYEGGG